MRSATTSIRTYHALIDSGALHPREAQVLAAFSDESSRFTRQQLSAAIGMPINAVCGRVRSLIDKQALEVVDESIDPITHKPQQVLALAKRQTEIF